MNKSKIIFVLMLGLFLYIMCLNDCVYASERIISSVSKEKSTYSNVIEPLNNFYNNLEDKEIYLLSTDKFLCGLTNECITSDIYTNVGLINLNEYNLVGGRQSYLTKIKSYFSMTRGESGIYNITSVGEQEVVETETSGIRPTLYTRDDVQVTGSGKINDPYKFVFIERRHIVAVEVNNTRYATVESPSSVSIIEDDSYTFQLSVNSGYVFDNVSGCTDVFYDVLTNKLTISNVTFPQQCVVNFKVGSFLAEVQYSGSPEEITVPYDGNYRIEAYGAQGSNSGGKGGYVGGIINLQEGTNIEVIVGGSNGYNGGGSGQDSGGGATSLSIEDIVYLIGAGGGGGTSGTVGGTGTGKGGASVGNGAGADGVNGGGGGSSNDDYEIVEKCNGQYVDSCIEYNPTWECNCPQPYCTQYGTKNGSCLSYSSCSSCPCSVYKSCPDPDCGCKTVASCPNSSCSCKTYSRCDSCSCAKYETETLGPYQSRIIPSDKPNTTYNCSLGDSALTGNYTCYAIQTTCTQYNRCSSCPCQTRNSCPSLSECGCDVDKSCPDSSCGCKTYSSCSSCPCSSYSQVTDYSNCISYYYPACSICGGGCKTTASVCDGNLYDDTVEIPGKSGKGGSNFVHSSVTSVENVSGSKSGHGYASITYIGEV